jgi:hypothetical protein
VSDVPDVTREKIPVGSRHRFSLEVAFRRQEAAAKLLNDAFYATLLFERKQLPGPTLNRTPLTERIFDEPHGAELRAAHGQPVEPLNHLNDLCDFCRMLLNQEIALVRPAVPLRGWLVLFRGA